MDSSSPNRTDEEEIDKLRADRVTIAKAAALMGLSYPTILKYVHAKKIQAVWIGNGWKISKYEIRRFLEFGNHPDSLQQDDQT